MNTVATATTNDMRVSAYLLRLALYFWYIISKNNNPKITANPEIIIKIVATQIPIDNFQSLLYLKFSQIISSGYGALSTSIRWSLIKIKFLLYV